MTPDKKSLQDAVELEKHGAKSIKSRHYNSVVMSTRNSDAKLDSLTPVSTRSGYF